MKYIGVVGRIKPIEEQQESWIGISDTYRKVLSQYSNVIPILILPYKDIGYGIVYSRREREEGANSNQRGNKWFSYDEYVIEYALKKDKPILGICLGSQSMALVDNKLSSSIFDFTTKVENTINHNQPENPYVHDIIIKEGSKLRKILGVSR